MLNERRRAPRYYALQTSAACIVNYCRDIRFFLEGYEDNIPSLTKRHTNEVNLVKWELEEAQTKFYENVDTNSWDDANERFVNEFIKWWNATFNTNHDWQAFL